MSSRAATEPSVFELDVYFAEGSSGNPTLAAHVESCARCAAYLAQLSAPAAAPVPSAQLERREPTPPAKRDRSAVTRAIAVAAAGALAAAISWQLFADPEREYVASKGVPAVQAVIRGTDGARVWDGKAPLRAGDAVALRASCEQYRQLSVAVARSGAKDSAGFVRIFAGACPGRGEALPFTLIADGKPGVERIDVVFSHARLDDAALAAALQRLERSDTIWVHRILLKKVEAAP